MTVTWHNPVKARFSRQSAVEQATERLIAQHATNIQFAALVERLRTP